MRSLRRVLPPLRGVTLLEVMITVAILGIVAALAVPNLGPVMRLTTLNATAEEVAMFLDETRRLAQATGRCHRVILLAAENRLKIERRAHADCVTMDNTSTGWIDTGRWLVPEEGIQFQLEVKATDTADSTTQVSSSIPSGADNAIVFRPNSRLWGDGDLDTNDDAARIVVRYALSYQIPDTREVRVTPVGRICVVRHNGAAPSLSVPTQCP